ncbi:sugar ABC transporter permease [Bacteroidia bacterium]|nr:sugar ABC transporter permease [Bacteroidia bacterium]
MGIYLAEVTKIKNSGGVLAIYKKYGLLIILIVLVLVMAIVRSNFVSLSNIRNMLRQLSLNGILALGMAFVILTGGIDLSVGSIVGLSGIVAALIAQHHDLPPIVAILGACLVGIIAGMANGVITAVLEVPAFITTLGTLSIFKGISFVLTNARPVSTLSEQFLYIGKGYVAGIPIAVIVLVVVYLMGLFILHRTKFGRYVYAIGGNETAAIVSGLKTRTIKAAVFTLSGLASGIAAVILTSRVSSGLPQAGEGYELDAIAAVVIGGVSLTGGEGRLWGVFVGVLILGVINNALDLLTVSAYYQWIIKGSIIILAVLIDRKTKKEN